MSLPERVRHLSPSQRRASLLAALVGVMLAVYAKALRPAPRPAQVAPPPASPSAPAGVFTLEVPDAEGSQDLSRRREAQRAEARRMAWARDPFTRSVVPEQRGGLQLSGIVWDATDPMAIINGETVRVGQEFDGYRVVDITQKHVLVSDGSQIYQLTIPR